MIIGFVTVEFGQLPCSFQIEILKLIKICSNEYSLKIFYQDKQER